MRSNLLKIHPLVSSALSKGKPVVALESTILSHGMPYPQNLECALKVEDVIRNQGAVPVRIILNSHSYISSNELAKLHIFLTYLTNTGHDRDSGR